MGSTGVKGRRADPAAGIPGTGYITSFQLSNTQDGWLYSAYMARLRCPRAARGMGACAQGSLRALEPPTVSVRRVSWSARRSSARCPNTSARSGSSRPGSLYGELTCPAGRWRSRQPSAQPSDPQAGGSPPRWNRPLSASHPRALRSPSPPGLAAPPSAQCRPISASSWRPASWCARPARSLAGPPVGRADVRHPRAPAHETPLAPQIGLGEASFSTLAPPFIDDIAPTGRKTTWLAIYFLTQPVGLGALPAV